MQTTRTRTIRLGEFTRAGLDERARGNGTGLEALLRQAVSYYLADRDAGRAAWRMPRFGPNASVNGHRESVEVALLDRDWEGVAEAAREQGVDPERLVEHAALYFLADLDSGRMTARIAASLG